MCGIAGFAGSDPELLERMLRSIVHRGPDGVAAGRLEPGAYEFVSRLCAGEALSRLLESAPADAPQLLAEQLGKGRLTAFRS